MGEERPEVGEERSGMGKRDQGWGREIGVGEEKGGRDEWWGDAAEETAQLISCLLYEGPLQSCKKLVTDVHTSSLGSGEAGTGGCPELTSQLA